MLYTCMHNYAYMHVWMEGWMDECMHACMTVEIGLDKHARILEVTSS